MSNGVVASTILKLFGFTPGINPEKPQTRRLSFSMSPSKRIPEVIGRARQKHFTMAVI